MAVMEGQTHMGSSKGLRSSAVLSSPPSSPVAILDFSQAEIQSRQGRIKDKFGFPQSEIRICLLMVFRATGPGMLPIAHIRNAVITTIKHYSKRYITIEHNHHFHFHFHYHYHYARDYAEDYAKDCAKGYA